MSSRTNRRIVLVARPKAEPTDEHFRLESVPVPALADGEALVRTRYLSLDPTIRGWMNDAPGYMPPIALGDPVRAGGIGEVVESRNPDYRVGALVSGLVGWQEYAVIDSGGRAMSVLPEGTDPIAALGVFGITGMTAYFGVLEVARPERGNVFVVSGAAGATGSVAGQIAKLLGCRVIGIAGSPEKCAWVTGELGFDACIDYKRENVAKRLHELCPRGIDVYFDNVGGEILDAVLAQIAQGARIALCGGISAYNEAELPPGPKNLMMLVIRRARMEGFLVLDYFPRFPEAMERMARWVSEGRIRHRTDVVEGLENTPAAFRRLFTGANVGKQVVKVG
jgi:hypothetical protein